MKIYPSIVLLFLALSQAFGQRFVKVFNTIDAMRTASPDVHTNAFVAGSSTLNDGGQGLFTWDASSTAATNTETIFGSTKVSTGRWFRQSGAGLDNNWTDEGTTNSTLAGIAKPWALHATSYIAVTNATGSAGFIELPSTNGTYVLTLTVGSDGSLQVNYGTTNMLKVLVGDSSGYAGGGTKALFDDGTFKSVSSGSITNLNPNPTDGYIPYRSNATVFGDSGLYTSAVTNIAINGYHYFYGAVGADSERLAVKALATTAGATYNTEATGTGTYRGHTFQVGGTNRFEIVNNGTFVFTPRNTNGYIYLQGAGVSGSFYAQANGTIATITEGSERIRLEPSASSSPYTFGSGKAVATANFFRIQNLGTNIFTVHGTSGYSGAGTLVLTDDGTYKSIAGASGVTADSTNTFTNKSYDASGTGNVLKTKKQLPLLRFPDRVDGAGCTYANTNDFTAVTFMRPQFSAAGATNANFCTFSVLVPPDWDTSVDPTASIKVNEISADAGAITFTIGMASVANGSSSTPTAANYVSLGITSASGSAGVVEGVSNVALTGWGAAITAGHWLFIQLQHDGSDASASDQALLGLEITYGSTQ